MSLDLPVTQTGRQIDRQTDGQTDTQPSNTTISKCLLKLDFLQLLLVFVNIVHFFIDAHLFVIWLASIFVKQRCDYSNDYM